VERSPRYIVHARIGTEGQCQSISSRSIRCSLHRGALHQAAHELRQSCPTIDAPTIYVSLLRTPCARNSPPHIQRLHLMHKATGQMHISIHTVCKLPLLLVRGATPPSWSSYQGILAYASSALNLVRCTSGRRLIQSHRRMPPRLTTAPSFHAVPAFMTGFAASMARLAAHSRPESRTGRDGA
jgi:hypothetical protein